MIRRSVFSGSWYPSEKSEIQEMLGRWTRETEYDPGAFSGIVPHAGWFYSGKIAAEIVKTVCTDADLVIIAGGHLPPGADVVAAFEEEIQTPFGNINNRPDLIAEINKVQKIREDFYQDNTVEIIVPMVAHFAPDADILWVRLPADGKSVLFAEKIFEITGNTGMKVRFLGSTDLTHYGNNYSFEPAGRGSAGLDWVKNVNDAGIIELLTGIKIDNAIKHAVENRSACSIGAAAAAAKFARLNDKKSGRLISYATSYDILPAESFVGYAGIVY